MRSQFSPICVSFGDQTQLGLCGKCLYLLSHLVSPYNRNLLAPNSSLKSRCHQGHSPSEAYRAYPHPSYYLDRHTCHTPFCPSAVGAWGTTAMPLPQGRQNIVWNGGPQPMSSLRGAEEEAVESGMSAVVPSLLSGYLGAAGIPGVCGLCSPSWCPFDRKGR